MKKISQARRLFCPLMEMKMGYPGWEVARFPGVSTSAIVLVGKFEDLPTIEDY